MAKKQIIKNKANKAIKKPDAAKRVLTGRVYVTATFNNTLVTLTDHQGNVLAWSSSGASGFKGARKSTPFAAISAMSKIAEKAKSLGMTAAEIYIKGPGSGRDAAIRAIRGAGLNVTMIADLTPIPYNGPRAKKKRRV